jgi:hypothetical protein
MQEDLEHPRLPLETPHLLHQLLERRLVAEVSNLGVDQLLFLADLGELLCPPLVQCLVQPPLLEQCLPWRSVQHQCLLLEQPQDLPLEQHQRLPLALRQPSHLVRPLARQHLTLSQARHLAAQALVQVRHHCSCRGDLSLCRSTPFA